MKNPKIGSVFIGLCLFMAACASRKDREEIPEVNLKNGDTREIKLSRIIENAEIIPLETNDNFLISHAQVYFTRDFILVGSLQVGSRKPGRLFRFTRSGRFVNEIGAGTGGRGPGEHIGDPDGIRFFEADSLVQVNWGGNGRDPQLFTLEGNFVRNIAVPKLDNSFDFIERWNDSIWFGSGRGIVGPSLSRGDSTLIHFFLSDGTEVHKIPRTRFSTIKRMLGLPPTPVHYQRDNNWKFFITGLDTLFRIGDDMEAVPEIIFRNENFVDYNTIIKTDEFDRKELVLSIAEGENYWLLFRQVLEVPFGSSWDVPIVMINKGSLSTMNVILVDDVFGLLPNPMFSRGVDWPDGRKPFQDNLMYLVLNADELVKLLNDGARNAAPKAKSELDKLNGLREDDNPVIFLFKLRDVIDDLE